MDSSFLEAVKAIYEKGKEFASKQYRQRFFEVAETFEVNSISTVFSKTGKMTSKEKGIFRNKTITPQQASLLERPNLSPYPSVRESDGKNK